MKVKSLKEWSNFKSPRATFLQVQSHMRYNKIKKGKVHIFLLSKGSYVYFVYHESGNDRTSLRWRGLLLLVYTHVSVRHWNDKIGLFDTVALVGFLTHQG